MPKVTMIKHARKDYPAFRIKKGDTYYSWGFRFGPEQKSITYPTRQQLTQSSFLQELYDIEDAISAFSANSEINSELPDLIDRIRDLQSQCEDSLSNMPDALQESSAAGETLQDRIDNLESWMGDLEGIDIDVDEDQIREDILSKTPWDEEKARQEIFYEDSLLGLLPSPEDLARRLQKKHDDRDSECESEIEEAIEEAWQTILDQIQDTSSGL